MKKVLLMSLLTLLSANAHANSVCLVLFNDSGLNTSCDGKTINGPSVTSGLDAVSKVLQEKMSLGYKIETSSLSGKSILLYTLVKP
jgi:hypothetical protein